MIRRSPQASLAAHKMDRERRELYVEGSRDRIFFAWLLGGRKDPNAAVVEIAMVESLGPAEGGERGRLLAFAEWMVRHEARLRCFADADWDRVLGLLPSPNVWLTDKRDLEGYTLRQECLEKVLRLGMLTDRLDAKAVLESVLRAAREVGILRLLSVRRNFRLPFQRTDLWRHVVVADGAVSVRLPNYLRALMQNAAISLKRLSDIQAEFAALATELADVASDQLAHGKDAFCMLERVFAECGAKRGEGARMMWTSFERVYIDNGSALAAAYEYLGAAGRN